jgi:hypothetical protein
VADDDLPVETSARRVWLKRVIVAIVCLLVGWMILRFVGRIDWSAVAGAMRQLEWWQGLALGLLLVIRQIFNAAPLKRFVPGLTQGRAMQNDLGANLVGTFAPPPGDIVLRIGMFKTWSISAVDGMTGVMLNMIVFYGARFIAPVLGLVVLAFVGIETGQWVTGLVSAVIAAAIIVALVLVLRSDTWAAVIGRSAAKVAKRVRPSVEPAQWADAMVDFRRRTSSVLGRNLAPALALMVCAIIVDGLILFLSLRFVGISAADLSFAEILAAFLLAYPLTILPLFGLGPLDAIMIASWTDLAGAELESTLLAGTIVWRTVTLGGTLALGAIATAIWRRHAATDPQALAAATAEAAELRRT